MKLGKLITAMVTPFDADLNVDYNHTANLIEHLINTGSSSIVVAGTTGESPTLTFDEKVNLFNFVVEKVNNRIPVIAGTGTNNTKESIELTKEANNAGVDGVMLVVPYYNKPSQDGLYEHFKQIAESTNLPVMLYNIPGRTSVNMTPDTIIRLANIQNIIAVKEASGDLGAATEIISKTADDFEVYSGDDNLTIPMLSIGGAGVVSVTSHILGEEMRQMIQHFENGELKKAAKLHQAISTVSNTLFMAPNPVPVKAALNRIGIYVGEVRLPLTKLTIDELNQLYFSLEMFEFSKTK